jgi:aminoglycoside phosphotransferase (APT) family kinase protein
MSRDIETPIGIVSRVIEQYAGERPSDLSVTFRLLPGGLTAPSVVAVRARYCDGLRQRRSMDLVVKQLEGTSIRERRIYEELVMPYARACSPRVIGVVELSPQRSALVLEAVPKVAWPWRNIRASQCVVERLAELHIATRAVVDSPMLADWHYEDSLEASAQRTYEGLLRCRSRPDLARLAKLAPAVRRIVLRLRVHRNELLAFDPLRRCVVHGDVHPGNVLIRRTRRAAVLEPIFIDWERARTGSPLEDVSSWLHSLGCWEPEARRRHDTILAAYLSAMGLDGRLTPEIRAAYWMAGASNALAGALEYHLAVAQDEGAAEGQRRSSARAAWAWLRVIRRADACWS